VRRKRSSASTADELRSRAIWVSFPLFHAAIAASGYVERCSMSAKMSSAASSERAGPRRNIRSERALYSASNSITLKSAVHSVLSASAVRVVVPARHIAAIASAVPAPPTGSSIVETDGSSWT
jgi:hypothetical protein